MNEQYKQAVTELLYKMADDALVIGHRNSEWTGLGPVLEEDIAFSSIAQDKVGHAYNLYLILEKHFNAPQPDETFLRAAAEFKCCHLVEHPIREYDFSLVRQFFFDHAELLRYESLSKSSFEPLAQLAKKFTAEIKYHVFHANTWLKQLGTSNEEAIHRLQHAIDMAFPLALGIFEESPFEDVLKQENIFEGEKSLQEKWLERISGIIDETRMELPDMDSARAAYGGRSGEHTKYLQSLLDEMTEVLRQDPGIGW